MAHNSNLPQNGAQAPKRGRGRPRKEVAAGNTNNGVLPKRKPGRPRKDQAALRPNEATDNPKRKPGRPRKNPAAPHEFDGQPKRGPGRPRKHPLAVTDHAVGAGNTSTGTPPAASNTTPPGQKHINGAVSAPAIAAGDTGQQTPPVTAPVATLPEREQVNAAIPPEAAAVNTGAEIIPTAPNTPNRANEQAKVAAAAVITGDFGQQTMPVSAPATALPGREPASVVVTAPEMDTGNNSAGTTSPTSAMPITPVHIHDQTSVGGVMPGSQIIDANISNAAKLHSWEDVTNDDVLAAINGSPLGEVVEELRKFTTPPLPLEIVLPQALVMIGCVTSKDNQKSGLIGKERLELKISTSTEIQGSNFYCLVAAPSGSGKDIGGHPKKVIRALQIEHHMSGSSVGVLNALAECPNLFLAINEFKNYLINGRWENLLLNTLTSISTEYYLFERFSKKQRLIAFAAPNLLAYIQPAILWHTFSNVNVHDGFFGRLLVTIMNGKPPCYEIDGPPVNEQKLIAMLSEYGKLSGTLEVHPHTFSDLKMEVYDSHLQPTAHRFCNEHGPRLALALARSTNLKAGDWEKAKILVRWFLRHHAAMLGNIGIGRTKSADGLARVMWLLRDSIHKCAAKNLRPNKTNITIQHSHDTWKPYDAPWRERGLKELIEFGEVAKNGDCYYLTNNVA